MSFLADLKKKAKALKAKTLTLYFAFKDPRVPWYAKVLIALIVAYIFSPIDLIPDFIPILGFLDDLVLVPIAIALVLKFIPPEVLKDCEEKTKAASKYTGPLKWLGTFFILAIWIALIIWLAKKFI